MKIYFYFILLSIIFSGCAKYSENSSFVKFYQPNTNTKFTPSKYITFNEIDEVNELISSLKNGYRIIGSSDYSSAQKVNLNQLKEFGKSLGADSILGNKEYLRTTSGVMPMTNYHAGQTYSFNSYGNSNTRTNSYNNRGTIAYRNSYGTSNTHGTINTPGYTTTTYMPYQRNVNKYHIYFLKKVDTSKMLFGATFKEIDSTTRQELSTNRGCQVNYVYNDTLAYKSDVMDFDIILEANSKEIYSCNDFKNIFSTFDNSILNLKIWRRGVLLKKKIKL
ncbi:hypothetical protein GA417_05520 [Poseidonibacter ostreae]|uniref:S1C family serine protease n=1 Tax=Poseidonibacter ostreae TaxID=2654171 RepID=UPI0012641394|nr:S1C family serine protease [Poseidonibacter ostreae]KAB7886409.1 hypothetical protein GA417_05520 [Poseidonibacter ostreae]